MTPELKAWLERRHGEAHPNLPRPLTLVRIRSSFTGWWVEGDNGTSRYFPDADALWLAASEQGEALPISWEPVENWPKVAALVADQDVEFNI
jgi:hypothetical protein